MLKLFLDSFQELLFPSFCLQCRKRLPCRTTPLLCDECLTSVSPISSPRCNCCGMPFMAGEDHFCGLCLKNTYAFDLARSAVRYQEPVISLISSLKFNRSLTGLNTLAAIAGNTPGVKNLSEPELILPVPLHIKRLRERQFNQTTLICQACFPAFRHIVNPDILQRKRATPPQTGLSGAERRKNLAGAFSLKNRDLVKGKNILLVDDVFTTGSTVNECAKVLKKAGAEKIEVFTLARAI